MENSQLLVDYFGFQATLDRVLGFTGKKFVLFLVFNNKGFLMNSFTLKSLLLSVVFMAGLAPVTTFASTEAAAEVAEVVVEAGYLDTIYGYTVGPVVDATGAVATTIVDGADLVATYSGGKLVYNFAYENPKTTVALVALSAVAAKIVYDNVVAEDEEDFA